MLILKIMNDNVNSKKLVLMMLILKISINDVNSKIYVYQC